MTSLTINSHTGVTFLDNFLTSSAYGKTWNNSRVTPRSQSSTSISTSVDRALTFITSKNTVIEDRLAVEEFLTNSYGVIAHLYSIPEKVTHYFGTSKMKLGVFSEPDSYEVAELYLEVETNLAPEEANAYLSNLNREWILSANDNDLMSLNITLKFI